MVIDKKDVEPQVLRGLREFKICNENGGIKKGFRKSVEEVEDVVLDLVSDYSGCDRGELCLHTNLEDYLELPDVEEIVGELSRIYNFELLKEGWREVRTIRDLIDYVDESR